MMHLPAARVVKQLAWTLLLAILLLCSARAPAQESHRMLTLPSPDSNGQRAAADLLRQLVEQSANGQPLPLDPSQVDPKLLATLEQFASQLGEHQQLSPQWQQWLDTMKQQAANSHPSRNTSPLQPGPRGQQSLPGNQPTQQPPGASPPSAGKPPLVPPRGSPGDSQPGTSGPKRWEIDAPPRGSGQTPTNLPDISPNDLPPLPRATEETRGPSTSASLQQIRDSKLTLPQRFDRIVEHARRQAILNQGGDPADPADTAGLSGMINKLLESSTDQLAERLQEAQRNRRGEGARRGSGPLGLDSETKRSLNKGLRSFAQNANRFSRTITAAETPAPSMAAPNVALPGAASPGGYILAALAMAALGLAALWHFLRRRQQQRTAEHIRQEQQVIPQQLATRADLIRAFHALAARTPAAEQRWWHHRRASLALLEAAPQHRSGLESLTELYEQARYQPLEEPLDIRRLDEVQAALGQMLPQKMPIAWGGKS